MLSEYFSTSNLVQTFKNLKRSAKEFGFIDLKVSNDSVNVRVIASVPSIFLIVSAFPQKCTPRNDVLPKSLNGKL